MTSNILDIWTAVSTTITSYVTGAIVGCHITLVLITTAHTATISVTCCRTVHWTCIWNIDRIKRSPDGHYKENIAATQCLPAHPMAVISGQQFPC